MSDHNIQPTFGTIPPDPKPWYKKPLTYIIAAPILIVIIIVNGIVGDGKPDAREASKGETFKTEAPAVTEEPAEEPVAEPVKEEPVTPEAEVDLEQMGLQVLREQHPNFALADDQSIIAAADAACVLFDSGGTFPLYIQVATENGITAEEAGALAGFAITAYCPEHASIADEY